MRTHFSRSEETSETSETSVAMKQAARETLAGN